MPTFATLVKFTPEGPKSIDDIGKAFEEGTKMAKEMGIKPIGAYATLGPYDMILIYEAPDEKVAATMPTVSLCRYSWCWLNHHSVLFTLIPNLNWAIRMWHKYILWNRYHWMN